MSGLTVITREGHSVVVALSPGISVMELVRDAGIDEVLALCGGCCACATCHVYVEDSSVALPPMKPEEDSLLDGSLYRESNSRLCCQISVDDPLASVRIRIAPEE